MSGLALKTSYREETAKGDNFAEYIVNVVDDMFHCSNYEKCEVTSYANGGYADE